LVDAAVANSGAIDAFLKQPVDVVAGVDDSWNRLAALVGKMGVAS